MTDHTDHSVQADRIQKVAPPAYLVRRLETFQIGKGGEQSYLLRDKVQDKSYDLEPWQFFVLEVLPGCDTFARLASVFMDRFGRQIQRKELESFLAEVGNNELFGEDAAGHPLLAPFCQQAYEVVDGKAKVKSLSGSVTAGVAAWADTAASGSQADASQPTETTTDLPAGIADAIGLDPTAAKKIWRLFDPRPMLKHLVPLIAPLRYAVYILPLLIIAAGGIAVGHSGLLLSDIANLWSTVSLIGHLVFSMFTVNLLAQLTLASTAYRYRATVSEFGIALYFGFLPRFLALVSHTEQLSRRERMWLHAGPILVRLALFSIGILVWYNTRVTAAALPKIALGFVIVSAVDLVFASANPFTKGSGYYLLATFLNEPHLRGRAFATLHNRLRGKSYQQADQNVLTAYALLVVLYMFVLIGFVMELLGSGLSRMRIGGSAIILVTALAFYLLRGTFNRLKKINEAYERSDQFNRWKERAVATEATAAATVAGTEPHAGFWSYAKRAVPLMLLLALFLPYQYQPGGNFVVYPLQKSEITPDVKGIVTKVHFDGGESLTKGTPIAEIKDDDNLAKLQEFAAKVREQEAVVHNLKTLPKPEAVKLAEAELETAITQEEYSREKVPRLKGLYEQHAVSFDEYDLVRKQHDVDIDQVTEKRANLELVKTGPTPDEIAAAEARLKSLEAQRDGYQDKVNRSVLYMPFDGHILTLHLQDRIGSYLEKGAFFAAVENTSKVTVEIDVPEDQIWPVSVGQEVYARPQAYNDEDFEGKVTTIDHNVTVQPTGNIVKVIATVDNEGGQLKTGMTGYAKVEGPTMPVWEAFSVEMRRFFNIDVWSWVP